MVTNNSELSKCDKAVWYWTAAGHDNMIVNASKNGEDFNIINEIGPGQGFELFHIFGGTYYFSIIGPKEGWTLKAECQD